MVRKRFNSVIPTLLTKLSYHMLFLSAANLLVGNYKLPPFATMPLNAFCEAYGTLAWSIKLE